MPSVFWGQLSRRCACWPHLQEVEKQYKEGTLKHDLVSVLKAAQPQALTVQGELLCEPLLGRRGSSGGGAVQHGKLELSRVPAC